MSNWLLVALVGLLGCICVVGLTISTAGDLEPLVAIPIASVLQLPGYVLIGLLMGLALRNLGPTTIAYGVAVIGGASLHTALLAVPGFEGANYSAARFNNGLVDSLYVLIVAGIFVLIGAALAFAFNVYVRHQDI